MSSSALSPTALAGPEVQPALRVSAYRNNSGTRRRRGPSTDGPLVGQPVWHAFRPLASSDNARDAAPAPSIRVAGNERVAAAGSSAADGQPRVALTDDGRAEFQALRGEIVERLRAQQQGMQFTLTLLTALVAGAAALPGRVPEEVMYALLRSTAMLPVTLLALLFAGLSAVFAEQEVMISYAGGYIAKRLRMPWEFTRHSTLGFQRRALVRAQGWIMLGAKYLLAAVPAVLLWSLSAVGVGDGTGVWQASASPAIAWASKALWVVVGAVLLASFSGVALALLSYRSIHTFEQAARSGETPQGTCAVVAVHKPAV